MEGPHDPQNYSLLLLLSTVKSGGALFHHAGHASLAETNFTGNMAGSEGFAVVTFGDLDFPDGDTILFANNSYFCPVGQYAFDKVRQCAGWKLSPQDSERAVAFPSVCSRRAKGGQYLCLCTCSVLSGHHKIGQRTKLSFVLAVHSRTNCTSSAFRLQGTKIEVLTR